MDRHTNNPLHDAGSCTCLLRFVAAAVLVLLFSSEVATAQSYQRIQFQEDPSRLINRKRKTPEPPAFTFALVKEIPLPGPLPGGNPVATGSMIRIPVSGGTALVDLESGKVEVSGDPVEMVPAPDLSQWVPGGVNNKYRFRSFSEGVVFAEREGYGWSREWRLKWHLRTPGGIPSPPLPVGRAVLFGCTDNRIYAVRAKNGHRLWVQDVGERVTRPLVLWEGKIEPPAGEMTEPAETSSSREFQVILTVPGEAGDGESLIALDPFDGKRLATYRHAPPGETIISAPAASSEGAVVVAVQKYKPSEAALLLFKIVPAGRLDTSGPVNDIEVKDEGYR